MRNVLFLLIFLPILSFCQDIDVQHYRFEIEMNDKSDTISGKAIISIKFTKATDHFSLDLTPVSGGTGMQVTNIVEGENSNDTLDFSYPKIKGIEPKLVVQLKRPSSQNEVKKITIWYHGKPKDGLIISKNKFGDRTFFGDNWPNRAHNWIPCNDRPDDKASFEFIVTAPSQYQVISNGIKKDERKLDGNKTVTHWIEDVPLSTKVMVIGVARFAINEYSDSPANVPVSAWVYPQNKEKGFYDYGVAPGILKFFSSYIAPFPYQKLANVQSTTPFGGMENASCIFYSELSVTGNRQWEDVLAHEIAHQWFGDMASEKSFAHLWLSEGFATYFTDLYIEHKYGKDSSSKRLRTERKEVVEFATYSARAVVDSTENLMSLLNANSYQKGSWILHMLRNEVGDSTFQKIVQTYYQQYKGSNADTRDFETVAEKVSGKNLKWFFDQWLYRPGIPQLQIEKKIDNDDVKLRITQQGVKFDFSLEVLFVRADGSSLKQIIPVNDQMIEYKIKVPDVKSVIIDPDTKLLYSEIK